MRNFLMMAAMLIVTTPALAQVRAPGDTVDSDQLGFIMEAILNDINVDDPATLRAAFPGSTFADFDRDRDGEFLTPSAGFGFYDFDLAVRQFNHDGNDADGDGVLGFVELECQFTGGPPLNPERAITRDEIPDGDVDCDGDGIPNALDPAPLTQAEAFKPRRLWRNLAFPRTPKTPRAR